MATNYRPELLPYAMPTTIGLPIHGLVKDGVVTLPNGKTMPVAGIADGSTWKAYNPVGANARARTQQERAEDTTRGYQWLPYALVSGRNRRIGPAYLGESQWIYSDPAGTSWLMQLEEHGSFGGTLSMRVLIKSRFGKFPQLEHEKDLDRVVGSGSITFTYQDEYLAWLTENSTPPSAAEIVSQYRIGYFGVDFVPDGSSACAMLSTAAPISTPWGWVEIVVSGTGSLVAEKLGVGISASMAFKGQSDVILSYIVDTDQYYSLPSQINKDAFVGIAIYEFEYDGSTETLECPSEEEVPYWSETTATIVGSEGNAGGSPTDLTLLDVRRILMRYADGTAVEQWESETIKAFEQSDFSGAQIWRDEGVAYCIGGDVSTKNEVLSCTNTTEYHYTAYWEREKTTGLKIGDVSREVRQFTREADTASCIPYQSEPGFNCPDPVWSHAPEQIYTVEVEGLGTFNPPWGHGSYSLGANQYTNNLWVVVAGYYEDGQDVVKREAISFDGVIEVLDGNEASYCYNPATRVISTDDDHEIVWI